MKAQGFDPVPSDMLKFNPAQPRWPAGNGRDSGRWSGSDGNVTPAAFRGGKERRSTEAVADQIRSKLSANGSKGFGSRKKASLHQKQNGRKEKGVLQLGSSPSGRSNRICLGQGMERKFPFRDCRTISGESMLPKVPQQCLTTRLISPGSNSNRFFRDWVGRKNPARMGRQ